MSESITPNVNQPSRSGESTTLPPFPDVRRPKSVRLWPAWFLIVLITGLAAAVYIWADGDLPLQAMSIMMGSFLLGVLLLLWWLTFSRTPWKTRLLTFFLFAVGFVGVCFAAEPTFRMYVMMMAGTLFIVASVVWLTLMAWTGWGLRLAGIALIAVALGGVSVIFAADGTWGNMWPNNLRFRWIPDPEQRALAYFQSIKSNALPMANGEPLQAAEGDWTQFRGPGRAGVVTGIKLARDWNANEPKLIWKHPVGLGWTSFAVIGDLLFTQEQRANEENVVCYDAATGKQVWTYTVDERFSEAIGNMGGDGPRATPTFHDGKIFALGATGVLTCLDARTGKKSWSRNILKDAGAKNLQWGMAGSPLVYDDFVVVNPGGENGKALIAYNRKSGEIEWYNGSFKAGYSSPQLSTIHGEKQVVVFHPKGVTGHDPANGNELWRYEWSTEGQNNAIQPRVLDDGSVLVSAVFTGTRHCKVTKKDDKWSAKEEWKQGRLKLYYNDMVTKDGYIYALDSGRMGCYDIAKGKRVWKDGDYGSGQILLVDDLIIVQGEQGDVALVEASPKGLKELGRFRAIEGKTWNHPVLVGNRLFVRNSQEAACYEVLLIEQPQPGNKAPDKKE